jgi:hypothetical protein
MDADRKRGVLHHGYEVAAITDGLHILAAAVGKPL